MLNQQTATAESPNESDSTGFGIRVPLAIKMITYIAVQRDNQGFFRIFGATCSTGPLEV